MRASRLTTAIAFPPMGTVNGLTAMTFPFWSWNVPHGWREAVGGVRVAVRHGARLRPEGAERSDDARPRLLEAEASKRGRAAGEESLADGQAKVWVVNHAVAVAIRRRDDVRHAQLHARGEHGLSREVADV